MNQHETIRLTQSQLMNRLFCSFTPKDKLEDKLYEINSQYKILYSKIFVLTSPESDEYMCTYTHMFSILINLEKKEIVNLNIQVVLLTYIFKLIKILKRYFMDK